MLKPILKEEIHSLFIYLRVTYVKIKISVWEILNIWRNSLHYCMWKHTFRCKGISKNFDKSNIFLSQLFRRCSSGYTGLDCQNRCPYPWFGDECKYKCNCLFLLCHHKIGCQPGNSFVLSTEIEFARNEWTNIKLHFLHISIFTKFTCFDIFNEKK